ncbi:serine beta-lactamase-like protein LACTB, mitochondrial [Littorina saxatilis]|uniref:serine beta-lactamase-like protein LACTB, mitochondrial n=1 Tax=Littorina saxatilis TaxID=31220 RepID=UPI0038B69270
MENGDLDLDKPVQAYVPQFPEKTVNGEKVTVTTRQLVSHLSGVRHYSKDYFKTKDAAKDNASSATTTAPSAPAAEKKNPSKTLAVTGEFLLEEYYIKDKLDSTESALALFKDDPLVHKPGTVCLVFELEVLVSLKKKLVVF